MNGVFPRSKVTVFLPRKPTSLSEAVAFVPLAMMCLLDPSNDPVTAALTPPASLRPLHWL